GRERARDEERLRVVGVADADVAVGVHHVLLGEDAVGDHEVFDDGVEVGHDGSFRMADNERAKTAYRSFPRGRESRARWPELIVWLSVPACAGTNGDNCVGLDKITPARRSARTVLRAWASSR